LAWSLGNDSGHVFTRLAGATPIRQKFRQPTDCLWIIVAVEDELLAPGGRRVLGTPASDLGVDRIAAVLNAEGGADTDAGKSDGTDSL